MAQKKLTKHQMKEDKLVTGLFKSWEWTQFHVRQIAIGAGSVVLLLVIIILFVGYRSSRSTKAAELFGQAVIEMQTPVEGQVQSAVTNFQILLRDYPKSRWSSQACFYLANLLFQDRQYPKAKEYFQRYVQDYGEDSLMTASAYAGIAECQAQENDFLSAGENFIKGAEAAKNSILAPEYLLQAGRTYLKAEQKQKAVEVFQRLVLNYPNSAYANTARQELAQVPVS
jgi:TolA-binding protein